MWLTSSECRVLYYARTRRWSSTTSLQSCFCSTSNDACEEPINSRVTCYLGRLMWILTSPAGKVYEAKFCCSDPRCDRALFFHLAKLVPSGSNTKTKGACVLYRLQNRLGFAQKPHGIDFGCRTRWEIAGQMIPTASSTSAFWPHQA